MGIKINFFNFFIPQKKLNDERILVGQVWNYITRPGEENSTATVLLIEKDDVIGVIIHIYLNGLNLKNSRNPNGYSTEIRHLPFSIEGFCKSATKLIAIDQPIPDFQNGYNQWRNSFENNKATLFSISIAEAIKYVEEIMN